MFVEQPISGLQGQKMPTIFDTRYCSIDWPFIALIARSDLALRVYPESILVVPKGVLPSVIAAQGAVRL
jgi:hypothetical protein